MAEFDLRTARINAGLSQRDLATKADVSRVTIQRLERGEGALPANAKRVADIFGVTASDLLPGIVSEAA